MKDKMIKAALSFAVLCGLGACTKNYLDINSNPYEVDKEQMEAKDYAIASGLLPCSVPSSRRMSIRRSSLIVC